jgi:hypothetical protein
MKTKVNINHRLLMGLLVFGSVFSMIVSSAFTTSPAWGETLAQSGGGGVNPLSIINPTSLGTENSVILSVGSVQAEAKDGDNVRHNKSDSKEDNNTNPAVTELSGVISNLFVTSTRASFEVGGQGARMDANLINGFSFENGDQVTVEGYFLGSNGAGTFLVTEIDKVP